MYKEMTKEDFLTSKPSFDISKMQEEEIQKYLKLSGLYRALLNKYLKQKCLENYENIIKESGLNFIPVAEQDQDFYQYYNNCGLTYYYVRNNIYIERLPKEEIQYLQDKLDKQDISFNPEDTKFIKKTFSKVIKEDLTDIKEPFEINFGPASTAFFARNDALVIGFRYNQFSDEINEEEFGEVYDKQRDFSLMLNQKLEKELKKVLALPVKVIEYDVFSVKSISNKNTNEKVK